MDAQRLCQKAESYGMELSALQLEQFGKMEAFLLEQNKTTNLTRITQPEELEDKHLIDSLLLAKQSEVEGKMVDVGSGAGFPGTVVKIYKPEIALTLLEASNKRVQYLEDLSKVIGLQYRTLHERAEIAGRLDLRESFDVATARAVAVLPILYEYALPLLKKDGVFIAMKSQYQSELEESKSALKALGGKLEDVREYTLPDGSQRALLLIRKIKETPENFPRSSAAIKKRPL